MDEKINSAFPQQDLLLLHDSFGQDIAVDLTAGLKHNTIQDRLSD